MMMKISSWYLTSTQVNSASYSRRDGKEIVVVLCGWEGNRRSGVALALRRILDSVVYPSMA